MSKFASVDHLGPEAIAAFVDGEMSKTSAGRAHSHLLACPECRAEVNKQRGASSYLRSCNYNVRAPRELLARLTNIAGVQTRPETY